MFKKELSTEKIEIKVSVNEKAEVKRLANNLNMNMTDFMKYLVNQYKKTNNENGLSK
jgi:hypothetical protein